MIQLTKYLDVIDVYLPVTLYSSRLHTVVAVTKACDRSKEGLTYLLPCKQTTKPQARADILLRLRILYIALVVFYLSRSSLLYASSLSLTLSRVCLLSLSLSLLYAFHMPSTASEAERRQRRERRERRRERRKSRDGLGLRV